MKILHCIRSADPRGGGTTEGVRQFAQVQMAKGHQVEVVSLDAPDVPWIKEFPAPLHGRGPVATSYGYKAGFSEWLEEKSRRMDVVLGHGLWQYNSFAMRRACLRTGRPYFVLACGMLDPWFKRTYPMKHLKKWLYWPWGEYPVLRDAQAVFFSTEEERKLARESFRLYKANEIVVGQGISTPGGNPEQQRRAFLEKYPGLKSKRIFLFLGRIHPKKGCDILLEAFARIVHCDESLHLVFAGPDPAGWQRELKDLVARLGIAQRVSWLGMIPDDLKWGAMRSAEAFVLPSHQENFGLAVAEALACGVPVLLSNKVNIWREIQNDNAGFADSDDAAGTQRLLESWLNLDAAQRRGASANALACFRRHFEISAVSDRMLAIFEQAIGKRP